MNRAAPPVIRPGDRRPVADPPGPTMPRSWALASGTGGAGRSTLALALALRLLRRGQRVLLVDADAQTPALAGLCGMDAADDGPTPTPFHDDLRLATLTRPLPGASAPVPRQLSPLIDSWGDAAVIDLGAGGADATLDLWLAAEAPLLVVEPRRLSLEASGRLLTRTAQRRLWPFLRRKLGARGARRALEPAWAQSGGRTGPWLGALAQASGLDRELLRRRAGGLLIHVVLNRVRRAEDLDVGHLLCESAQRGLGLDLSFRAAVPHDDSHWIRDRRARAAGTSPPLDLLAVELDELLVRVSEERDIPQVQAGRSHLQQAAALSRATDERAPLR